LVFPPAHHFLVRGYVLFQTYTNYAHASFSQTAAFYSPEYLGSAGSSSSDLTNLLPATRYLILGIQGPPCAVRPLQVWPSGQKRRAAFGASEQSVGNCEYGPIKRRVTGRSLAQRWGCGYVRGCRSLPCKICESRVEARHRACKFKHRLRRENLTYTDGTG
jgi:hypothetical protein